MMDVLLVLFMYMGYENNSKRNYPIFKYKSSNVIREINDEIKWANNCHTNYYVLLPNKFGEPTIVKKK